MRAPWIEPFALRMARDRTVEAPSNSAHSALSLALFSGGDERVLLNPATGRTKYGTPRGCAEDEIWFSSSTASALSPRGRAAAADAWGQLVAGGETLTGCHDDIRRRLVRLFGVAGTEAILTGSGSETLLITLALARNISTAPITTLIVGCAETGSSVPIAASGRHFFQHAAFSKVAVGERVAGLEDMDLRVDAVEIRDASGRLRPMAEIDAELVQKVAVARQAGRDVIIVRLDVSKTGQSAPGEATLAQLCDAGQDHICVLADCCQLRTSADYIQSLLERGFLIALTGSKFAGGPLFCGALLVPPPILARLRKAALPIGLSAYSAQCDWPSALRDLLELSFLPSANIGLALRWQAALAEIERFFAWPSDLRTAILTCFYEAVAERAAAAQRLERLPEPIACAEHWGYTILGITMRHSDGRVFDVADAAAVQRRLRGVGDDRCANTKRFHLGQPVRIGEAGVLRICASAVIANDLAAAMAEGASLADAFAPITGQIDDLFDAWSAILDF